MREGILTGRPWSARKDEAPRVRRAGGGNREEGRAVRSVPDGAGGEWVEVDWGRRPFLRHRPEALEWLDLLASHDPGETEVRHG